MFFLLNLCPFHSRRSAIFLRSVGGPRMNHSHDMAISECFTSWLVFCVVSLTRPNLVVTLVTGTLAEIIVNCSCAFTVVGETDLS